MLSVGVSLTQSTRGEGGWRKRVGQGTTHPNPLVRDQRHHNPSGGTSFNLLIPYLDYWRCLPLTLEDLRLGWEEVNGEGSRTGVGVLSV